MDAESRNILETVNFIKDRMLTKDEGATKADLRGFASAPAKPARSRWCKSITMKE
jgi:hypothetical protein